MNQDNTNQYHIVVDEKATGPFTYEEIIKHSALKPESLVWKPGLENWVAAKSLPELDTFFRNQQETQFNPPPPFNQHSPHENHEFKQHPYNENQGKNRFADNPQYQQNHYYNNHDRYYHNNRFSDPYQNGYRPNMRTNWLPWAIVATVVGFFASCIGAIFGIIAIVQANKANTYYAQGFEREGDAANSNAKIMTIIGLIFAGIGIIVAFSFGNIFSSFANLY